jgi:putative membrane protein
MKTRTTLLTIATVVMLWGCGSKSTDSKELADSTNEAMADTTESAGGAAAVAEEDSKFAVDAANGGLAEVQLGEAAQSKGTDPKVKEFGKMMVTDHTKANEELKTLAASKNITLPTAPSEEMMKAAADVTEKSGKEFDKAYIAQMKKDHDKTIKLFEDGQKNCKDPELKAFIEKTLPVLRTHKEHIESLDKSK